MHEIVTVVVIFEQMKIYNIMILYTEFDAFICGFAPIGLRNH